MLNTLPLQSMFGYLFVLVSIIYHLADSIDPQQEARCLSCIRNVSSSLAGDVNKRCEGYYCGPYQISYTYWAEAGKPGNNQSARDYEKCVRDKNCAEQAVKAYFKKFKRDCNNDGQIDCIDMAALHKGGPTSCASDWFYKSRYWLAFNKTDCVTNQDLSQEGYKAAFEEQATRQPVRLMNQTLTSECLDCICDAVSGCNTSVNNCGSGTVCGPFAISQAYWKDGRKPGASWTACARTRECSSVAVKNYMEKYKRDCNGDGYITCEDYAAIHRRGPRACSNKDLLKDHYWNKFLSCRANQAPRKDMSSITLGTDPDSVNQIALTSRGEPNIAQPGAVPTSTADSVTSILDSSQSSIDALKTSEFHAVSGSSGKFDFSQTPSYELTPLTTLKEVTKPSRPTTRQPSPQEEAHNHIVSQEMTWHKVETTSSKRGQDSTQVYQSPSSTTLQQKPDYDDVPPLIIVQSPSSSVNSWSPSSQLTTPHYRLTPVSLTTPTPINMPFHSNQSPSLNPTTSRPSSLLPSSTFSPTSAAHTLSAANKQQQQQQFSDSTQSHHLGGNQAVETLAGQAEQTSQIIQPLNGYPIDPHGAHLDEIDASVPDFPLLPHSNNPDRRTFDSIVRNIVVSPEFNKSYPPLPEFLPDNKQAESSDESNKELDSKSQQIMNTNHSKNQSAAQVNKPVSPQLLAVERARQGANKNTQRRTTTPSNTPSSQSNQNQRNSATLIEPIQQQPTQQRPQSQPQTQQQQTQQVQRQQQQLHQQTQTQQQQQQQQSTKSQLDKVDDINSSDIASIFGSESVNISSLFEKGLNESSRIASECLECICDASSNCDTTVQCISKQREKNRCGMYMISWNQYQESDISLTSMLAPPAGVSEEMADEKMYYACTTERSCAEKLIHLYIEKHQKDCNGDGKIDCYDIAAIHRVGPDNCNSGKFLSSQYWRDFNICYTSDRLTTTMPPQISATVR